MKRQTIIAFVVAVACLVNVIEATQSAQNVYVFGTAYEDTGAFKNLYASRGPIVPGQPISPPTVVYGPPLSAPRVEIVGPLDRFSDGRIWVDFFCAENGLTLKNFFEITKMPPGNGNLVNFAIAGATVNGNLYNSILPNQNFGAVIGSNGLNAQVASFVSLKNAIPAKVISPKDVFIISVLGGNDVGAIMNTYLTQPGNLTSHITTFVASSIASIQTLYDNGARNMLITYADSTAFGNLPFVWKASPSGSALGLANVVANLMWPSFISALNARLQSTMPQLAVELVPLGNMLNEWLGSPEQYGVRRPLGSDVGDPRASPISFPFPTYYDMSLARPGLALSNALFYSDTHPTEHTHNAIFGVYNAVTIAMLQ